MPDRSGELTTAVVVCAYTDRRWDDLCAAVAGLAPQTRPADEVVVVIDHNDLLLHRARKTLPGLLPGVRVIASTGRKGLSGARNTGVAATTADVVAFLDDDAVPHTDWLAELVAPYGDGGVLATGGTCAPAWPGGSAPAWFPAEFGWVVGGSYTGQPTSIAEVRNVIGANMSFHRDVFTTAGLFREDIGRVGTTPLGCEETELCIRARQANPGGVVLLTPAAVVDHKVSADRTRLRYFLSRCRAEGLSKAQVSASVGAEEALSTERAYVVKTLPVGLLRGLGQVLLGRVAGAARAAAIVAGLAATGYGYVRGRMAQTTRPEQARELPQVEVAAPSAA